VREVPDTRFLIIGEGELRHALEHQARGLGLERHLFLTGFRSDAMALVKSLDIFVVSSLTEALGTAVLEAMACRRPVVATRAGSIPETIADGETGLLVPPQDDEALAASIVRLLRDDDLRARLAEAGRARVEAEFSVERVIERTLDAYRRVLGRQ
jgi:glycosyltransferase involved in cell wall biosynthesis